jgi:uncharacterized protein (DUF1697 family)
MALVVFLRGVNVGGHRTFRPSVLARQLRAFDVVNVGAAGTFVVRGEVSQKTLRAELVRRLPFDTHVMICGGDDVLRLASSNPFRGRRFGPNLIHFVSVLAKARRPSCALPHCVPATGAWELKVLGQQDRFVYGVYRRTMRAIRHLGRLDRLFDTPATTRSWSTITAVASVLETSRGA